MADTDWRLDHGADEMEGRSFRLTAWWPYREHWQHDHCEFCFAEITDDTSGHADYNDGWVTSDDSYSWVCPDCFTAFQPRFGWIATA